MCIALSSVQCVLPTQSASSGAGVPLCSPTFCGCAVACHALLSVGGVGLVEPVNSSVLHAILSSRQIRSPMRCREAERKLGCEWNQTGRDQPAALSPHPTLPRRPAQGTGQAVSMRKRKWLTSSSHIILAGKESGAPS
eukprot:561647-Rhodomonas_salina.1